MNKSHMASFMTVMTVMTVIGHSEHTKFHSSPINTLPLGATQFAQL
jgi:hypothetical protein